MASYKLNYFNGKGRAELTRLIFAAAGATYTDNRIEWADWPARKEEAPLGQLPYLEINGVQLPQSIAMARFVAREHNLAGKTNLEQAQADAIVDTLVDLINSYYKNIFSIKDEAAKEEAFTKFLLEDGAKGAANIEKLIGLYGSNGHAVGDSLTWADILIFEITSALFAKVQSYAEKYPNLTGVFKTVAANEKIAEYIKNRPETPF